MKNTPYRIKFTDKGKYLHAAVSGEEDSLEVSIAYWTEIITKVKQEGIVKILVTEDFKNVVSAVEMYVLIEEITKFGITELQIAFVDADLTQFELNKFAETVAVNRGAYGRVFNNEADAEKWLLTTN